MYTHTPLNLSFESSLFGITNRCSSRISVRPQGTCYKRGALFRLAGNQCSQHFNTSFYKKQMPSCPHTCSLRHVRKLLRKFNTGSAKRKRQPGTTFRLLLTLRNGKRSPLTAAPERDLIVRSRGWSSELIPHPGAPGTFALLTTLSAFAPGAGKRKPEKRTPHVKMVVASRPTGHAAAHSEEPCIAHRDGVGSPVL